MELVYDVAHNIAKFEEHDVGRGRSKQVCVHRKGATRAFPPGHPDIPAVYAAIGQPVIIPGSMGTASWVLAGQAGSMEYSFGTTCHGAGRMMSRTAAVKLAAGRRIDKELDAIGIVARARGHKGLAEEQPAAYKDVDHVVDVVDKVGISKKVARLRPGRRHQGLTHDDFSPLLASHFFISLMSMTLSPLTGELLLGTITRTPVSMRIDAAGQHLVDGLLVLVDVGLQQPHSQVAHLVGVLADGRVDRALRQVVDGELVEVEGDTVAFLRSSGNLDDLFGDEVGVVRPESEKNTRRRDTC